MRLQLDHLVKLYHTGGQTVRAVDDVSLSLNAGEFVALRGPSGCGKSTMLLMAGGLLAPDSGTVTVEGQNPYLLGEAARAGFRAGSVGFVFQQFHLLPYLSVLENILAPALATAAAGDTPGTPQELHARAVSLAERFGLEKRLQHTPGQLSMGERQRTALARAVLRGPQVLLADEPTGNLDTANADIVLTHLQEFATAGGTVLLVTHDERAAAFASRQLTMSDGRLVETSTREPSFTS